MRQHTLLTNRARSLRKAMSLPEVMLWKQLRGRAPDRPTFRRQHPIGSVIIDFYCPSARLVVEVDGVIHRDEQRSQRDAARDTFLRAQGLTVVRIPAAEVLRDAVTVANNLIVQAEALKNGF